MLKHFTLLINKNSPITPQQFDHALKTGRASLSYSTMNFEETYVKTPQEHAVLFVWDQCKASIENPLIEINENFVFLCSGVWHHTAYKNNQELLHALVTSSDPYPIIASLGGVFALLILDLHKEKGNIYTTVAGCPNTYYTQTDDLYAAGTCPLHLNLLAGMKMLPEYDTRAFVSFIKHEYFPGELLPFKNVFHIPLNSEAKFEPYHHKIQEIDTAIKDFGLGTRNATAADYDDITQIFIDGTKKLATLYPNLVLMLSGGKDSRVLAAVFKHLSLDCQYQTTEWPSHPDVILAKRIADVLKFKNHTIFTPDEISDEMHPFGIEDFFKHVLWDTGAMNVYCPQAPIPMTRMKTLLGLSFEERLKASHLLHGPNNNYQTHISGASGEIIRGGYATRDWCYMWDRDTVDRDGAEIVARRVIDSQFNIFPDERECFYKKWCEEFISKNTFNDFPAALLERLYLFENNQKRVNPSIWSQSLFLDNKLLRAVDKLKFIHRFNEEPHFEVIKRLAPETIEIPFDRNRWGFEKNGPRKGDESGYEKREPLKIVWGKKEFNYTYFAASTDMRDYLESAFFDNPLFQCIYQVVDKDKLRELWYSKASYHNSNALLFLRTYATGLILSQKWLQKAVHDSNPLIIRYDANWSKIYYTILDKLDNALKNITIFPVSATLSKNSLTLKESKMNINLPILQKYPEFQETEHHKLIAENWLAKCPGTSIRASLKDSEFGRCLVLQNRSLAAKGSWVVLKIGSLEKLLDKILSISFISRASEKFRYRFYIKHKSKIISQEAFKAAKEWTHQSYAFYISSQGLEDISEDSQLEFWIPLGYDTLTLEIIPKELVVKEVCVGGDTKLSFEEMITIKNYLLQNYRFIETLQRDLNDVKEQFFVEDSNWNEFLREVLIIEDDQKQPIHLYDLFANQDVRHYLEQNYPSLPALIRNSIYKHLKVIPKEQKRDQSKDKLTQEAA